MITMIMIMIHDYDVDNIDDKNNEEDENDDNENNDDDDEVNNDGDNRVPTLNLCNN